MFIMNEGAVFSKPKNIKYTTNSKRKLRMECVLQTCDVVNRNGRFYSRKILQEAIDKLHDRIYGNVCQLLGELDHPISESGTESPVRQVTVLYTCASHRFREMGWDGNKLVSIIETLSTPNGKILRDLVAEDGIKTGFSFRGMGELQRQLVEGKNVMAVISPIQPVTWDCVSYPSHNFSNVVRITENVSKALQESTGLIIDNDTYLSQLNESFSNIISQDKDFVYTKGGAVDVNLYEEMIDTYARKLNNVFGKRNK